VAGTASDAGELHRLVAAARPDVAIVDIRMPPAHRDEGIVAAQQILDAQPGTGVLVLSHHLESAYALRLLDGHPGGAGYLLKERVSSVAVLADALKRLVDGECVIDPTIVARLMRRREHDELATLSARERDVLAAMAEGRSNRGISQRLSLSPKTVEVHVGAIMRKLGIDDSPAGHRRVLAVLAYLRNAPRQDTVS
jgi:serine/threonine-protein kinase